MLYASICIDLETKELNREFLYIIPKKYEDIIEIGHRVIVPFGKKKLLGFVLDIKNESDYDITKLKEIIDILDIKPVLNKEAIMLARYISNRYFSFLITTLKNMIPSALRVKYQNKVKILDINKLDDELKGLFKSNIYLIKKDDPNLSLIKKNVLKGALEIALDITDKLKEKEIKMVSLIDSNLTYKSSKAREVIEYLDEISIDVPLSILINDMGFSRSVIETLKDHKNIDIYEKEVYREPSVTNVSDKVVELNSEQTMVYNNILNSINCNETFLIHGVTGSGKTEIYLKLIEDVIKSGKEAIMLVPEISLTPQMSARFKARFKEMVAILHSRLTLGERYDEWRKILNKKAKICIGARSAIFAPFQNLGIIIIDEAHERTYIQDTNPKYDSIEVAQFRTKYHNIPLILGSATPRVDSYYKALNGEYKLLKLESRANKMPMPKSTVVDMKEELKSGNKSIFSKSLKEAIIDRYKKGEQSILFLNRRGFSSFVMCRSCGYTITCPNCETSLTYHKSFDKLTCHYCGYQITSPKVCPKCSSTYIRYVGGGTEKVCEEVLKFIPDAKILRVDLDTTTKKNSYMELFESFRKKEALIMVGTQIVAKGLDFPDVTLVGVINADISLRIPSYTSNEQTFNLLEQVSGRAGRAKIKGEVIIQTYNPDNFVINCAKNHDYKMFYNFEINERKVAQNPPFTSRVEILITGTNKDILYKESINIKNYLKNNTKDSKIYGPCEDFIFKINNMYRYKITIKFENSEIKDTLNDIIYMYESSKDVIISITRM